MSCCLCHRPLPASKHDHLHHRSKTSVPPYALKNSSVRHRPPSSVSTALSRPDKRHSTRRGPTFVVENPQNFFRLTVDIATLIGRLDRRSAPCSGRLTVFLDFSNIFDHPVFSPSPRAGVRVLRTRRIHIAGPDPSDDQGMGEGLVIAKISIILEMTCRLVPSPFLAVYSGQGSAHAPDLSDGELVRPEHGRGPVYGM